MPFPKPLRLGQELLEFHLVQLAEKLPVLSGQPLETDMKLFAFSHAFPHAMKRPHVESFSFFLDPSRDLRTLVMHS